MTKTLGQIAFEAWNALYEQHGNPHDEWEWLDGLDTEAWQTAAEAVVSDYMDCPDRTANDDLERKREAVIEAAKKWRDNLSFEEMVGYEAHVLYSAVGALEAAEKEER